MKKSLKEIHDTIKVKLICSLLRESEKYYIIYLMDQAENLRETQHIYFDQIEVDLNLETK